MAENQTITPRLRAAPSPTGRVHVGTIRSYLYNYLYARKHGGVNILRIEDTDQKRSVPAGAEAIIEVFESYGITFDEGPHVGGDFGPYIQTERKEIYKKYSDELLEKDGAYRCFCSEERLKQMREEQTAMKLPTKYDGLCRAIPAEEAQKRAESGEEYVIRLKMPDEGITEVNDTVMGKIKFQNELIDDAILVKADGIPTYHFAVVVDDHLMGITHMLRGTEWIPSIPLHVKLYEYFGWKMPKFVHLPLILNPDGNGKLSKRHGALPAIAYLRKGYLPEAVNNYLALVGWSPPPDKANPEEVYTMEELIELFDFDRIQKHGARYDQNKFDAINGKHIRLLSTEQLADRVYDWADRFVLADFITDKYDEHPDWELKLKKDIERLLPMWRQDRKYFVDALKLVHERIVYLGELPELLDFFYEEKLSWSDDDWRLKESTKAEMADALEAILPRLEEVFDGGRSYDHDKWEQTVRSYADELGWRHGELFLGIRSATTGKLQSPPLVESFEVLGWEKVRGFMQDAVEWLRK